jgi:hypothetical protein
VAGHDFYGLLPEVEQSKNLLAIMPSWWYLIVAELQGKQMDASGGSVMLATHGGGKAKRFSWDFHDDYVAIYGEKGMLEEYSLCEILAVLGWLAERFGTCWFPLKNNVQKLGRNEEGDGLGVAILRLSPGKVRHAQGSSYLGVVLEDVGILEWNNRVRGIEWRIVHQVQSLDELRRIIATKHSLRSSRTGSVEKRARQLASRMVAQEGKTGSGSTRKPPYVFQSRKELLKCLKKEETRVRVEKYYCERYPDIASVVHEAIGSNTVRAFHNLRAHPSVVLRDWASAHFHSTLETLKSITDRGTYFDYVHKSALDLSATWRAKMNAEIGYGRSTKLLNLVLKKLPCFEDINGTVRDRIIRLLHVPLDSYALVGLRELITSLKIPRNATMKFIDEPTDYITVQLYILDAAMEAGVPPIYYDFLAWNMAH